MELIDKGEEDNQVTIVIITIIIIIIKQVIITMIIIIIIIIKQVIFTMYRELRWPDNVQIIKHTRPLQRNRTEKVITLYVN